MFRVTCVPEDNCDSKEIICFFDRLSEYFKNPQELNFHIKKLAFYITVPDSDIIKELELLLPTSTIFSEIQKGYSKVLFISMIRGVDWTNQYYKVSLSVFLDYLMAYIVFVFVSSNKMNSISAENLFRSIYDRSIVQKMVPIESTFRSISGYIWSKVIKIISDLKPAFITTHSIDMLKRLYKSRNTLSNSVLTLELVLLSDITYSLSFEEKIILKYLNGTFKDKLLHDLIGIWDWIIENHLNGPLHYASLAFLSNLYKFLLLSFSDENYPDLISVAYKKLEFIIKNSNNCMAACEFRALLISYCQSKFCPLSYCSYFNQFLQKAIGPKESTKRALNEINIIMNNPFGYSQSFTEMVINEIIRKSDIIDSHLDELCTFFSYVYRYSQKLYFSSIKEIPMNHMPSAAILYHGIQLFLSPASIDSDQLLNLKSIYSSIAIFNLYVKYEENHLTPTCYYGDNFMSIHKNIDDFVLSYKIYAFNTFPKVYNQQKEYLAASMIRKIIQNDKNINNVFVMSSIENEISFASSISNERSPCQLSLLILPFLSIPEDVIDLLISLIFFPNESVSFVAFKSLELILFHQSDIFSNCIDRVAYNILKLSTKRKESLFIGCHLLTSMVEIMRYRNISLTSSFADIVSVLAICSLCSIYTSIRKVGIYLISIFHESYPHINSIWNFINENNYLIVHKCLSIALSYCGIDSNRYEFYKNATFIDIAKSDFIFLYIFLMGSFSSIYSKSSFSIENVSIKDQIKYILDRKKNDNDNTYDRCLLEMFFVDTETASEGYDIMNTMKGFQSICVNIQYHMVLSRSLLVNLNPNLFIQYLQVFTLDPLFYSETIFSLKAKLQMTEYEMGVEHFQVILDVFPVYLEFFRAYGLKNKNSILTPTISIEKSELDILLIFLEYSANIFELIYNKYCFMYTTPFFINTSYQSTFRLDELSWISFCINLIGSKMFKKQAEGLLYNVLSIISLPKDYSKQIIQIVLSDHECSDSLLSIVLIRCEFSLLKEYLVLSRQYPVYFVAFCHAFDKIEFEEYLNNVQKQSVIHSYLSEEEINCCREIIGNMGQIFALSLYFMACFDKLYSKVAISVIRSVSLGYSIFNQYSEAYRSLVSFFSCFNNGGSNNIYNNSIKLTVSLSKLLSECMSDCGESFYIYFIDFVFEKPELCSILIPWITKISFSGFKCFINTKEEFHCLSGYKLLANLLSRSQDSVILPVLDAVIANSLDPKETFHYLNQIIIFDYIVKGNNDKNNIIRFLFTKDPVTTLDYICHLFSFQYWFYCNVLYGPFSIYIDYDLYANDGETEKQEIPITYDEQIPKVLSVFGMNKDEIGSLFYKYEIDIYIYFYIVYPMFSKQIDEVLYQFIGNQESYEQYMFELIIEKQNESGFYQTCLWGICCGNLTIASRSINILLNMTTLSTKESLINALINSIFVIETGLFQKSNGLALFNKKQWYYHMTDVDRKVNWKSCCYYLEKCFQLLYKITMSDSSCNYDLFWLSLSFFSLSSQEQSSIQKESILIAINQLGKPDSNKLLKIPKNTYKGIFVAMKYYHHTDSVFMVIDLIRVLYEKQLFSLFYYKEIESKIIIELILFVIDGHDSIDSLNTDELSTIELSLVIAFFGSIVMYLDTTSASRVFDFCKRMVMLYAIEQQSLKSIISSALQMTHSHIATFFLRDIISFSNIEDIENTNHSGMPKFPQIIYPNSFSLDFIVAKNGDPFSLIESLPPIFPHDTGLLLCPMITKVFSAISNIKPQPFSQWNVDIFKQSNATIVPKILTLPSLENIGKFFCQLGEKNKNIPIVTSPPIEPVDHINCPQFDPTIFNPSIEMITDILDNI